MGIATSPFDLIVILCREPHSAAIQLRVFPSCGPSSMWSASVALVDFLGVNPCAPITSHLPWGCIYLPLVSCTWFSPGHGPLMGRICPRVSQRWRGYFTSQVYPLLDGDQVQDQMEANTQGQEEEKAQVLHAQGVGSPPQRLTRSQFKALGNNGRLFSLFVISLFEGA